LPAPPTAVIPAQAGTIDKVVANSVQAAQSKSISGSVVAVTCRGSRPAPGWRHRGWL